MKSIQFCTSDLCFINLQMKQNESRKDEFHRSGEPVTIKNRQDT